MVERRSFFKTAFSAIAALAFPKLAKSAPPQKPADSEILDAVCAALKEHSKRTNESFAMLSRDILENRRRIGKVESLANATEDLVWVLEGHTIEESQARLDKMMAESDWANYKGPVPR